MEGLKYKTGNSNLKPSGVIHLYGLMAPLSDFKSGRVTLGLSPYMPLQNHCDTCDLLKPTSQHKRVKPRFYNGHLTYYSRSGQPQPRDAHWALYGFYWQAILADGLISGKSFGLENYLTPGQHIPLIFWHNLATLIADGLLFATCTDRPDFYR